jgi:hypothetical protein
MERNKQLKIIQAINTEIDTLERERNVYLNLLCEDISGDTEEFILATLREINEDIVYLEGIQEEVINGYKDNS